MKFRTEIPIQKEPYPVDYQGYILLMGSCFSIHIHQKLAHFKFPCIGNPFGILYNPIAIEKVLTRSLNGYQYATDDLFMLNEQWHSFDAHSELSSPDQKSLIANLNNAVSRTATGLANSKHIIITLGSAWVYRHIETDAIVGNCHKVPQKKFLKELLSVKQIIASLENSMTLIKALNPHVKFIFTVSPVRHLKDGFTENSRSKAHLITAIQSLVDKKTGIFYFPSYEILTDDLRDYRYYEDDMVHPNKKAIDYVWNVFKEAWIDPKCFPVMQEVDNIQKGLGHKPFNPDSNQHRAFREQLNEKIQKLEKDHGIQF